MPVKDDWRLNRPANYFFTLRKKRVEKNNTFHRQSARKMLNNWVNCIFLGFVIGSQWSAKAQYGIIFLLFLAGSSTLFDFELWFYIITYMACYRGSKDYMSSDFPANELIELNHSIDLVHKCTELERYTLPVPIHFSIFSSVWLNAWICAELDQK